MFIYGKMHIQYTMILLYLQDLIKNTSIKSAQPKLQYADFTKKKVHAIMFFKACFNMHESKNILV